VDCRSKARALPNRKTSSNLLFGDLPFFGRTRRGWRCIPWSLRSHSATLLPSYARFIRRSHLPSLPFHGRKVSFPATGYVVSDEEVRPAAAAAINTANALAAVYEFHRDEEPDMWPEVSHAKLGGFTRRYFTLSVTKGPVRLGHPRDKGRSTDWSRHADFMKPSPSSWPCGQINQNHRSVFVRPVEDDLLPVGRNIKRAHLGQVLEPRQASRAHRSHV
jgi:hypothetical protein